MKKDNKPLRMSSHKARTTAIAALVCSIVLSLLGVTPTTEEMPAADLQELVVNVAGYIALVVVPAAAAYFQRNYLK